MEDPQGQPTNPDSKAMIDRLLLEKTPLAGIARVIQVSEDWLQGCVNACYEALGHPGTTYSLPTVKLG